MIKKILLGSLLLSIAGITQAQNVGIGTNTPAPSAKLEIQSTDRGLLIPRINIPNLSAAAPVTAPTTSLLVYNNNVTTGLGYYYWDGTEWVKLLSEGDNDHDWYEVGTTTPPDDINDFIYTQGRVSIGTTTSSADLNIGGAQTLSFIGPAASSSISAPSSLIIRANNGLANISPLFEEFRFNGFDAGTRSTVNIRGIDANHVGLTLGLNAGQVDNVMQIVDNANLPVTVFDNRGNLGIGTSNPTGQLHILSSGGEHTFTGQVFRTTRLIAGQQYGLQLQHDAARTYFNTINNSGTPTTQMVIQSVNGFIGMGTNVPTEKLDVVGSARIREIDLGTAATDTILVADITGRVKKKDANSLGLVSQTETEWRDAGTYIIARDAETAGNNVVVNDAGRLGIGTNTPAYPFHMVGNIPSGSYGSGLTLLNSAADGTQKAIANAMLTDSIQWIQYVGDPDGFAGVAPNAYELWDYPRSVKPACCRRRFVLMSSLDNPASVTASPVIIGPTGNLGIGGVTPSSIIHARGNSPVVTLDDNTNPTTIAASAYTSFRFSNSEYGWVGDGSGSGDNITLFANGTTNSAEVGSLNGSVHLSTGTGIGSEKLTVIQNGNVGVGTTTPTVGRLQVRQSADNSNSGMTVTNVASSTGLRMWVDVTNKGRIDASAGGGADLIINSTGSGDVGIGTETPTSKLHVENGNILNRSNTFTIHEARSHSNNLSQGPHFIGTRGGGTLAAPTHPANDAVILTMQGRNALNSGAVGSGITIRSSENHSATNQGSDIFFATVNNGATAASNRMIIQNDGKVGVGIMDSDARLHVASGGNGLADYTAKFTSSPSVAGAGGIVFTNTESAIANGFKVHTTGTGGASHIGNNFVLSSIGVNSGAVNQDNILNIRGDGRMGWGIASSPSFYVNTVTGARLSNGGAWTNSSDRRLKTNIVNSKYGLSTILSLRPVDYTMIKSEEKQVGFIAQEVQKIVPEAVYGTEGDMEKNETLSLSYDQIVPVLTKAIQEQQEMIEKQNEAIELLKKQVEELQKANK